MCVHGCEFSPEHGQMDSRSDLLPICLSEPVPVDALLQKGSCSPGDLNGVTLS